MSEAWNYAELYAYNVYECIHNCHKRALKVYSILVYNCYNRVRFEAETYDVLKINVINANTALNILILALFSTGALRLSSKFVVFSTYLCLDSLQPMAQKKHLSMQATLSEIGL